MFESVVRFTDDSAGLEKTLRLFQGFCNIAVAFAVTALDADYWAKTRGQFALGELSVISYECALESRPSAS